MTKDIKNLTPAVLKKEDKNLNATREFKITIGDTDYKMSHDVTFRKTKQVNLLNDLIQFFSEGANKATLLEVSTEYTALLIIKHFTSLEISDDISEAIAMLDVLVDLEILNKIIDELPEDEVSKLYELLNKTVENLNESIDEAENKAQELVDKVENKEIKEMITGE